LLLELVNDQQKFVMIWTKLITIVKPDGKILVKLYLEKVEKQTQELVNKFFNYYTILEPVLLIGLEILILI